MKKHLHSGHHFLENTKKIKPNKDFLLAGTCKSTILRLGEAGTGRGRTLVSASRLWDRKAHPSASTTTLQLLQRHQHQDCTPAQQQAESMEEQGGRREWERSQGSQRLENQALEESSRSPGLPNPTRISNQPPADLACAHQQGAQFPSCLPSPPEKEPADS